MSQWEVIALFLPLCHGKYLTMLKAFGYDMYIGMLFRVKRLDFNKSFAKLSRKTLNGTL